MLSLPFANCSPDSNNYVIFIAAIFCPQLGFIMGGAEFVDRIYRNCTVDGAEIISDIQLLENLASCFGDKNNSCGVYETRTQQVSHEIFGGTTKEIIQA